MSAGFIGGLVLNKRYRGNSNRFPAAVWAGARGGMSVAVPMYCAIGLLGGTRYGVLVGGKIVPGTTGQMAGGFMGGTAGGLTGAALGISDGIVLGSLAGGIVGAMISPDPPTSASVRRKKQKMRRTKSI